MFYQKSQNVSLRRRIGVRALAVGTATALLLSVCRFSAVCNEVRGQVLRLHVLANSDSDDDQQLKLSVRDAVLCEASERLEGVTDTDEALATVQNALPQLQAVAQHCVRAQGYDYAVQVEVARSYFSTRAYERGTLPAGWYTALQVRIGEGAGHNWWCVVFPPLCVSAAESCETAQVLSAEACEIVESPARYRVRFKLVEWWESLVKSATEKGEGK